MLVYLFDFVYVFDFAKCDLLWSFAYFERWLKEKWCRGRELSKFRCFEFRREVRLKQFDGIPWAFVFDFESKLKFFPLAQIRTNFTFFLFFVFSLHLNRSCHFFLSSDLTRSIMRRFEPFFPLIVILKIFRKSLFEPFFSL